MGFSIYRFITGATDLSIRLRGFKRQFVEANGAMQHYYVSPGKGSLPPVVVVHGLSGDATDLAPMFGLLRKHFSKVLVPDLPGHGFSEPPKDGMKSKPLLDTFARGLDQMIQEPVILMGNSLGGLASIRYANQSPRKVKALVLYSPGGAQMSLRELLVFKSKFRNRNRTETRNFLNTLVTKAPWYRRIVENVLRNRFLQPSVQQLIANVTPDILLKPEEVHSLKQPTLLVWGKADTLQTNQVNFFKKHLPPQAQILEPEHFAHCPFLDYYDDCTRMAVDFASHLKEEVSERQLEFRNTK